MPEQGAAVDTDSSTDASDNSAPESYLSGTAHRGIAVNVAASSNKCPVVAGPTTTGATITMIPIDVPGGRKGLTPSIELTYNSMRGVSWLGRGWDLELGSVQKRGDNYYYCTGGNIEKLVLVKTIEEKDFAYIYESHYYIPTSKPTSVMFLRYVKRDNSKIGSHKQKSEAWSANFEGFTYTFGEWGEDGKNAYQHGGGADAFSGKFGLVKIKDKYANKLEITYETDQATEAIYPQPVSYLNYKVTFDRDATTNTLSDIRIQY
jgi:hypothetical protein